jgi:UDP-glucose 4-epimerase
MILITGGMGFIGLHTARRFLDAGEEVVLTQFHARREPDFIKDEIGKRVSVETLDVTNADAVLDVVRRHKVTSIVHLAVPGLGALTPAQEFGTNTTGLINVLEAAREEMLGRVSLASSLAVYSNVAQGPWTESMPLPIESSNPTEAYKKTFEILGLFYASQTGLDVVALRIGGIYGPLYHSMANLPSRLTHAAIKGVEPDLAGARRGVPMAGDQSDMCYVKDCAQGIQRVHMAASLPHRIYNIGSGRATRNSELADAVNKAVPGSKISLQEGSTGRTSPNSYCDLTQICADVGYEPEYDVYRGVADYAQWLRSNPQ